MTNPFAVAARRRVRRGLATYVAIMMLLIVGSILAAVGIAFAADARRTRAVVTDAQLRQLLTAGAIAAMRNQPEHITLPDSLASAGAKLTFVYFDKSDQQMTVTIRAELGRRHVEQIVKLRREGDKWTALSATLDARN